MGTTTSVCVAIKKLWLHAWCTNRRFGELDAPCSFCGGCSGRLQHLVGCEVLHALATRFFCLEAFREPGLRVSSRFALARNMHESEVCMRCVFLYCTIKYFITHTVRLRITCTAAVRTRSHVLWLAQHAIAIAKE